MSERNLESLRRWIEAFNARDVEGVIACFDPSIEYHSTFAAADGAVYHGHDGIRRWHRDLEEAWGEEIGSDTEVIFDLGECTLQFFVFHARGRSSGAEVAMPGAQVSRWRDGRMVYAKGYADREEALRDLDVSEDELEPIEP